jgi:hypothetical protein
MSVLARIGLALLLGLGALLTYFYLDQQKAQQVDLQKRLQRFVEQSLSNPGETIVELQEIHQKEELSDDESLLLFELLAESSIYSHAPFISFWEDKKSQKSSIDWQVIDACISYRDGNVSGALNQLAGLIKNKPAHRRLSYEYNRIQFLVGGIDSRISAKLALRQLSKGVDRWAYKSLRILAFTPPRPGIMKQDLIIALEDLRSHQRVTSTDFLRASEIFYRIEGDKQPDQIFKEILTLGKDRVSSNDFGYWLVKTGQPQMALKLISKVDALSSEDSFMIRFQALLENNQSNNAEAMLVQAKHLSQENELRARTYLKLARGDTQSMTQFFEDAKRLKSVKSLLDAARLALMGGDGPLAYAGFREAWALKPEEFNHSVANQFLQISLSSRNTKEAHQITSEIKRRNPEKFGNANNHCYLSLLMGENVESLEKEALRICNAFPGNPSFLSTLALAKLLREKPGEALEVMRSRGPVPLLHGEKAMLACILQATGKNEDAEKVATGLVESRMLPEEWALLKKHDLVITQ